MNGSLWRSFREPFLEVHNAVNASKELLENFIFTHKMIFMVMQICALIKILISVYHPIHIHLDDSWEQTRSATLELIGAENKGLVQVDDTATYDLANEAKALQLKVVNKAPSNIRIQEISSAGQRLDVPNGATATLGFLIRARQEPLKFKAFETETGKEVLLNGQKILPIDVDSKGYTAIIVVHEEGI